MICPCAFVLKQVNRFITIHNISTAFPNSFLNSLHLLHGAPSFVESILSTLKATSTGMKQIPITSATPLDNDSLMALSVKMCLRTLPNTALLLAFRKEEVALEEDLGHIRPLRYAVEDMRSKSAAASFEVDAPVGTDGESTTKFVIYIAPASRFSQLLKRAIPTLDKRVTKDNTTHFVVAALPKEFDELKMQSGKSSLATF